MRDPFIPVFVVNVQCDVRDRRDFTYVEIDPLFSSHLGRNVLPAGWRRGRYCFRLQLLCAKRIEMSVNNQNMESCDLDLILAFTEYFASKFRT